MDMKRAISRWDIEPCAGYISGLLSLLSAGILLVLRQFSAVQAHFADYQAVLAALFLIAVWRDRSSTIWRCLPFTLYTWYRFLAILPEARYSIANSETTYACLLLLDFAFTLLICHMTVAICFQDAAIQTGTLWFLIKRYTYLLVLLRSLLCLYALGAGNKQAVGEGICVLLRVFALVYFYLASLFLTLPSGIRLNHHLIRSSTRAFFKAGLFSLLVTRVSSIILSIGFSVPAYFLVSLTAGTIYAKAIWDASLLFPASPHKIACPLEPDNDRFSAKSVIIIDYSRQYLRRRWFYRQKEYERIQRIQEGLVTNAKEKQAIALTSNTIAVNRRRLEDLLESDDRLLRELSAQYHLPY